MSPNSLSYFITFGCLSLLVSGCGGDAPKPSNSASLSPTASAVVPAPSATPLAVASPPPVSLTALAVETKNTGSQPNFSADIAAGLIPASDTETVTKAVSKGRVDPFAAVIAQPVVQRVALQSVRPAGSNSITSQPATASDPSVRSGNNLGITNRKLGSNLGVASIADMMTKKSAIASKSIASNPQVKPGVTATVSSIPAVAPLVPVKTALLNPPAVKPAIVPELAQAIQVSGFSEINGQTQVIVKLPGESFSRYISVGEKVLNGKVLIKRVQDRTAIAPIVVLEEAGIEVLRRVGEKPMVAIKESLETPK